MKRIAAIARKELLHIRRDPRSLAVAILMPMGMVLLYGYAIDMDMKELPVAFLDWDRTSASAQLVRDITSNDFIFNAGFISKRSEIEPGFRRGDFRAAVVIPAGFAIDRAAGPSAQVQIIIDGADGTTAVSVGNYLSGAIARLNRMSAESAPINALPIEAETRVWFNPELKSANFIVPGLVAVIMMMICSLLTSIALTREKETGTMEQMLTTPAAPGEVILGKVAPYLALAALDAVLVLGIGLVVFRVPMNGSWSALAGYSFIYLLIALGFGIMVSTIARTQQVAMMFALMVTMLPTLLLSGFIFPISSMPPLLQGISRLIPATYYLHILRGVMLKGVNWFPLDGGVMTVMALIFLGAAAARFKKGLE